MPEKNVVATVRILAEIWWLKQFGPVTVQGFARHFHRSQAQIKRDIEAIGDARDSKPGESFELDWDQLERGIVTVQGINDLIQKPALTSNEALQILCGLRVMLPLLDQSGQDQAASLIMTLAPLVEGFDASRLIYVDVHDFSSAIAIVKQAMEQHRQLTFTYQDRHGHITSRRVDPIHLDHRMDGWYLEAWCYLASNPRTFRLSAMSHVTVSDQEMQQHPSSLPQFLDVLEMTTTRAARWLVDDHIAQLISADGDVLKLRLPVWDQQWVLGLLIELGEEILLLPQEWEERRCTRAKEIREVWNQLDRV